CGQAIIDADRKTIISPIGISLREDVALIRRSGVFHHYPLAWSASASERSGETARRFSDFVIVEIKRSGLCRDSRGRQQNNQQTERTDPEFHVISSLLIAMTTPLLL